MNGKTGLLFFEVIVVFDGYRYCARMEKPFFVLINIAYEANVIKFLYWKFIERNM